MRQTVSITHLWSRWVDLLAEREPGTTLALFRVGCGSCVLLVVGGVAVGGMVPVVWLNPADGGYRPVFTPWLFDLIGGVTPRNVWLMVGLALTAGALLVVGLFARLAALLALQSVLALTCIDRPDFDDLILCNALWLLFLSRSSATLSLACRLKTGCWVTGELVPAWPRYLIIFQIVLFYWAAGLHKVSVYWTPADGYSALYYIMQRPGWVRWDMSWLADVYPLTRTSARVTINGPDMRAGSPPSHLMKSGSIAPTSAPVRQMPTIEKVTTQISSQNRSWTWVNISSGVQR